MMQCPCVYVCQQTQSWRGKWTPQERWRARCSHERETVAIRVTVSNVSQRLCCVWSHHHHHHHYPRISVKACSRETNSPSRASKTYGRNAFQIIHIHTTVINSGRTHTTQHRTHTVGSDCGYSPGWCRSHPTVSEMTWNVSSGTLNHAQSNPWISWWHKSQTKLQGRSKCHVLG